MAKTNKEPTLVLDDMPEPKMVLVVADERGTYERTLAGYFADTLARGTAPTVAQERNASDLIERVGKLLEEFGEDRRITSGHRTPAKTLELRAAGYAAALGGTHETGNGVDLEDEDAMLDDWISGFDRAGGMGNDVLEKYGLYREHPSATRRWCHLQNVPPRSGRRSFYP